MNKIRKINYLVLPFIMLACYLVPEDDYIKALGYISVLVFMFTNMMSLFNGIFCLVMNYELIRSYTKDKEWHNALLSAYNLYVVKFMSMMYNRQGDGFITNVGIKLAYIGILHLGGFLQYGFLLIVNGLIMDILERQFHSEFYSNIKEKVDSEIDKLKTEV